MKTNQLIAVTALALSGCAMPYQSSIRILPPHQSSNPITAEQQTAEQQIAITANNAEIDNVNAERQRERIAEEELQVQRLNAIQSSISRNMPHYMPMPASPTVIQVQPPVDQYLQ